MSRAVTHEGVPIYTIRLEFISSPMLEIHVSVGKGGKLTDVAWDNLRFVKYGEKIFEYKSGKRADYATFIELLPTQIFSIPIIIPSVNIF